jgi:type IV pilus assembly protein PilW
VFARRPPGRSQRGVSIVELMVGMTIGLIVISSITALLVNALQANNDVVRASRVNQELRAAMDLMVREIRRAGYRGDHADYIGLLSSGQTYSNTVVVSEDGTQLDLAYDADRSGGTFSADETYGFRLSNGAVQALRGGTWSNLTDPGYTRITKLAFCFLPSEDDECLVEPPAASQVTIAGGSTYVVVKELRITLTGEAVADPSIVRSLRETVRVRNDEVVSPAP